ncbi:MAG: hypothetical protein ACP5IZ_05030 [Thermoprotei archaeon]|jgi:hypothetical protein
MNKETFVILFIGLLFIIMIIQVQIYSDPITLTKNVDHLIDGMQVESTTWCSNAGGCTVTWLYVEASITGTSVTDSNGYGYAEGGFTDKYIGICPSYPLGGNYMSGYMFADSGEFNRFYGPIDHSYSYNFKYPPVGQYVGTSIDHEYCDCGTTNVPGVVAWLNGMCST